MMTPTPEVLAKLRATQKLELAFKEFQGAGLDWPPHRLKSIARIAQEIDTLKQHVFARHLEYDHDAAREMIDGFLRWEKPPEKEKEDQP